MMLKLVAAVAALASYSYALPQNPTASASSRAAGNATSAAVPSPTVSANTPCGTVSSVIASILAADPKETNFFTKPSEALACLNSVPLNKTASLAFIEYIEPFLEMQATIGYLKAPPVGYTLRGVDVFDGLTTIRQKLNAGAYKSQFEFESEVHYLVNVLTHDFHLYTALPLLTIFSFGTAIELVSISNDNGTSIPKVFFKSDWDAYLNVTNPTFKPSALTTIDGRPAADYLQSSAESSSNFNDVDAIYNQNFYSIAATEVTGGQSTFTQSNFILGIKDSFNYHFENGSVKTFPNLASTIDKFRGITSGAALYKYLEVSPPGIGLDGTPTATTTSSTQPSSTASSPSAITSLPGYPTPAVIHPLGYTSGYFMKDNTAVLAIQGFQPRSDALAPNGSFQQQAIIEKFLAQCRQRKSPKLIIDLSANGGGTIFNGYDTFNQLFPSIVAYGGFRYRSTPAFQYLNYIYSNAGGFNETVTPPPFSIQESVDQNLLDFPDYKAFGGPFTVLGDNMTAISRWNLSDPLTGSSGIIPATAFNNTNVAPQAFQAQDIVLLMDGSCGSTCSIFAELMKSQAGVRSVVVGGRPINGPMNYVGGSKAPQRYNFGIVQKYIAQVEEEIPVLKAKNINIPTLPSNFPQITLPPLGNQSVSAINFFSTAVYSVKNGYSPSNSDLPLQFTYEAANCRLFYTLTDIYDISNLWARVAAVAWGSGTCVPGSTTRSDGRITPDTKANDTVPYDPNVFSNATIPDAPGLVKGASPNTTSTSTAPTATGTGTAPSSTTFPGAAAGQSMPHVGGLVVVISVIWALL